MITEEKLQLALCAAFFLCAGMFCLIVNFMFGAIVSLVLGIIFAISAVLS